MLLAKMIAVPFARARVVLALLVALGIPRISARGQQVLATNEGSNSVSVIAGNKVVATIPVGNQPRGLAVSKDGKRAYVALGRIARLP